MSPQLRQPDQVPMQTPLRASAKWWSNGKSSMPVDWSFFWIRVGSVLYVVWMGIFLFVWVIAR